MKLSYNFSSKPHLLAALVFLGTSVTAFPDIASAQVTYFKKPPTAAQLRAALQPARSENSGRPAGVRTRGIVWNKEAGSLPANTAAQTTPAQTSAAAPVSVTGVSGPAAGMPIRFGVGSANLASDSIGFVQSVAEMMRGDPSVSLVIEGHTDASGGYRRNMVLSWERAMGVYRVLVEDFGIEPKRLTPVGKGPTEPMPGTAPSDGTNRRVQFRLNG